MLEQLEDCLTLWSRKKHYELTATLIPNSLSQLRKWEELRVKLRLREAGCKYVLILSILLCLIGNKSKNRIPKLERCLQGSLSTAPSPAQYSAQESHHGPDSIVQRFLEFLNFPIQGQAKLFCQITELEQLSKELDEAKQREKKKKQQHVDRSQDSSRGRNANARKLLALLVMHLYACCSANGDSWFTTFS